MMIWPLRAPMPVSTTSVARVPTTMAILGNPIMAQTWSETRVAEFSGRITDWAICATAAVDVPTSAARYRIDLNRMAFSRTRIALKEGPNDQIECPDSNVACLDAGPGVGAREWRRASRFFRRVLPDCSFRPRTDWRSVPGRHTTAGTAAASDGFGSAV